MYVENDLNQVETHERKCMSNKRDNINLYLILY